jgi:hypothetical protein
VCVKLTNAASFQKKMDANGDDRIGIEDVIYILQKLAGLK